MLRFTKIFLTFFLPGRGPARPGPAGPGLVHRGEIFFAPGKPEVVPTPRGSRGSKFDLPSPSTALGALQNDLF